MASGRSIQPGSQVVLHFSLSLLDGSSIDSNFRTRPASFQIGDGSMLPGFEEKLLGLRIGDELETTLPPEEAFGTVNEANVHRIARARFTQFLDDEYAELEAGAVVSFKDAAGFDIPGVVKEKYAATVVVDFNHPLAGKDIVFKARIVNVIAPDSKAVDIKL